MTRIHWALYGERFGAHALLNESSGAQGSNELTQYTDRPGTPTIDGMWGPLFSAYPFRDFFVFLITTPDPTASRAGMVVTRAAIAELREVSQLPSLSDIFGNLSQVDSTSASPLEFSTRSSPKKSRAQTIALASAIVDGRVPALTTEADYLYDIDVLWQAHPELRPTLSFHFQFAPEYAPPVPPLIVATHASLRARWNAAPSSESQSSAIARWLVGPEEGLEGILADAGIAIRSFGDLSLLKPYLRVASAPQEASLLDCRKALAALTRLRTTPEGTSKTPLVKRTVDLIGSAKFEEILVLRNVDAASNSLEFLDIRRAVESRLLREAGARTAEMVELLREAPAIGWWRSALLTWVRSRLGSPDASSGVLIAFLLSDRGTAWWGDLRADLLQHEAWFLSNIKEFPVNTQALARELSWPRLGAASIAAQEIPAAKAVHLFVRSYGGMPTHHSGLEYLIDKLGPNVLASGITTPSFIDIVAQRVSEGRLSIHAVFDSDSGLATKVLERLTREKPLDASASELLLATAARVGLPMPERELVLVLISKRAPALLLQLPKLELSDSLIRTLRTSATDSLVVGGAAPTGPDVLFWLDPERLRANLGASSPETARRAFQVCDALTDNDYSNWLTAFFTRTASSLISAEDANAISAVLESRAFPISGRIVADTVRTYRRSDVKPILARIEERYGLSDAPKRERPIVLIATALRIERDAVASKINLTYDSVLKADRGQWPSHDPLYTVYTIITDAGNLEAQATLASFLHHVRPQYAFFVGVAGAVKDFKPGDVAYCKHAYYYHGGKEGDGKGRDSEFRSRPRQEHASPDLVQLAHRVASDVKRPYSVKDAIFGSGEVVLASNEIDRATIYTSIKNNYNDVQVVEMEGFGFLRMMREAKVEHPMVLRGISDRLTDKSESDAHGSQEEAVANAVNFLIEMLGAIGEQRTKHVSPIALLLRALNPFA